MADTKPAPAKKETTVSNDNANQQKQAAKKSGPKQYRARLVGTITGPGLALGNVPQITRDFRVINANERDAVMAYLRNKDNGSGMGLKNIEFEPYNPPEKSE